MIYIVRRDWMTNSGKTITVNINKCGFSDREKAERFALLWAKQTECERLGYELQVKSECKVIGMSCYFIFTIEEIKIGTFFD